MNYATRLFAILLFMPWKGSVTAFSPFDTRFGRFFYNHKGKIAATATAVVAKHELGALASGKEDYEANTCWGYAQRSLVALLKKNEKLIDAAEQCIADDQLNERTVLRFAAPLPAFRQSYNWFLDESNAIERPIRSAYQTWYSRLMHGKQEMKERDKKLLAFLQAVRRPELYERPHERPRTLADALTSVRSRERTLESELRLMVALRKVLREHNEL